MRTNASGSFGKDDGNMGFELAIFGQQLDADYLEWLVDAHAQMVQEHFSRLWDYYANPMVPLADGGAAERKAGESGRGYVQAQEYGLPARITGLARGPQGGVFGARALRDIQRKEVVIENDIAWRVNAAADFLSCGMLPPPWPCPRGARRTARS